MVNATYFVLCRRVVSVPLPQTKSIGETKLVELVQAVQTLDVAHSVISREL